MKSEKDGVKYPKGIKVNARRKRALERLENNLISSNRHLKILIQDDQKLIEKNNVSTSIINTTKNINRIEKEIEVLKQRIY